MEHAAQNLVGRREELDLLLSSVETAASGLGTTWVIAGEPGIGKSRLVEAFAAECASEGVRAVWGRAWETGGAPAYWPWIQILRTLLRQADDEIAARLGERYGAVLQALLPELAPDTEPVPLDESQARFRLFDQFAMALTELASDRPVVLLLEDVHAMDIESRQLLEFASAHLRGSPIVLVATTRALFDSESAFQRHARVLELARFTDDEVARVLEGADESIVREVMRVTEGNPLFVFETARYVRGLEHLPEARADVSLAVPRSVTAVILQHMSGIPETARRTLSVASILGRDFDVPTLAELAELPDDEVAAQLDAAQGIGLVTQRGRDQNRFRHQLMQQTLYDDLEPGSRAELHRRAVRILAERARCGDGPWSTVAEHAIAAGVADDVAVEACIEAAEEARARFALEIAADVLQRALHSFGGQLGASNRADVHLRRARLRMMVGDVEEGQSEALAAVELARQIDDAQLLARAALEFGGALVYARVDPRLVELLREAQRALEEVPRTDGLQARVMARLAAALQPATDPREPFRMAREAIERARSTGDSDTLIYAIRTGVSALMDLADPKERAALNREHVQLATRLDRPIDELKGRMRLVFDLFDLGEVELARAEVAACDELTTTRLDHPCHRWSVVAAKAMVAMWDGEVDEALTLRAEARRLSEVIADPNAPRCLALQGAYFAAMRGDVDEFTRLGPVVEHTFADSGSPDAAHFARAIYAGLATRFGIHDTSGIDEDWMAAVVETDDKSLIDARSRLCVHHCDAELAGTLRERLRGWEDHFVSAGAFGMAWYEHASSSIARFATVQGELDVAVERYETAVEAMRSGGGDLPAAWVALELADVLETRGDAVDAQRARRLRGEVARLAEEFSLPGLARKAGEGERQVDDTEDGQPRHTSDAFSFSLVKNGDVWTVERAEKTFALKNVKGVRILARLLAEPGREFHVLDLDGVEATPDSDAGEMLDDEARDAYRRRVRELRGELREAEEFNDPGRAERAREELEFIASELSRAVGLHGESRRASDATERSRVNVQRRIKDGISRIRNHDVELARHLDWAVSTGAYCCYDPE
jgi:hypothetical protein